jgi:hypothetical protein
VMHIVSAAQVLTETPDQRSAELGLQLGLAADVAPADPEVGDGTS